MVAVGVDSNSTRPSNSIEKHTEGGRGGRGRTMHQYCLPRVWRSRANTHTGPVRRQAGNPGQYWGVPEDMPDMRMARQTVRTPAPRVMHTSVAQMVERPILNRCVVGSSPTGGTGEATRQTRFFDKVSGQGRPRSQALRGSRTCGAPHQPRRNGAKAGVVSSAAEHPTFNRRVLGSIPRRPTTKQLRQW